MSKQQSFGQYMTPAHIADAMATKLTTSLADAFILDPACGDGNLLLAVARAMKSAGSGDISQRLFGIDLDPVMVLKARRRLAQEIDTNIYNIHVWCADFLRLIPPSLLNDGLPKRINCVISNPPYGQQREYRFFEACQCFGKRVESVFLAPIAFADRVEGPDYTFLHGRPLGVTTGHVIAHHFSDRPYKIKSTRGPRENNRGFAVLTGIKLYEVGAGTPPQTRETLLTKPFSSDSPKTGWLECIRTGDIEEFLVKPARLYVKYGKHLAHPKELARFRGPKVFVRRVPAWKDRRITAAFSEEEILCAGDVLVLRHSADDISLLHGLECFLNSPIASEAILADRPSVRYRMSFPKISAKDLNKLFDRNLPTDNELRELASTRLKLLHESGTEACKKNSSAAGYLSAYSR